MTIVTTTVTVIIKSTIKTIIDKISMYGLFDDLQKE